MPNDNVEAFLRAESEAHQLLDELTKLRSETESYAAAQAALGEAAEHVGDLSGVLADLARRLGEVVQTLRSIGTPELLRAQEATTAMVAAMGSSVAAAADTVRALHDNLNAKMEQQAADSKAAYADLNAQIGRERSETHEVRAEVVRLGRLVLWATGALLAATGVVIAILLLVRR